MTHRFLPYGRQLIEDDDVAAVAACLRQDLLTGGSSVGAFERALAEKVGAPDAAVCSSGTAALHLAMLALGVTVGDLVVVPAITFLATANAARYVGAEVIFADVDPDTGLMGADHVQAAVDAAGRMPKVIVSVHLAGQCTVDLPGIAELAKSFGSYVVEDACHALGTRYGKDLTPTIGACDHCDLAVFSFHPVKLIAMGEGGAVTARDEKVLAAVKKFRNHGMSRDPKDFQIASQAFAADGSPNPWYYEMADVGFNYRASDIHCALGVNQLAKVDQFIAARQELTAKYDSALANLAPIVIPMGRTPNCSAGWHLYMVLIDFAAAGISRAALMRNLRSRGVGTQVHYIPVNRQPYYRDLGAPERLPGADTFYERCLSLPLFSTMCFEEVDYVVSVLEEEVGPSKRSTF